MDWTITTSRGSLSRSDGAEEVRTQDTAALPKTTAAGGFKGRSVAKVRTRCESRSWVSKFRLSDGRLLVEGVALAHLDVADLAPRLADEVVRRDCGVEPEESAREKPE